MEGGGVVGVTLCCVCVSPFQSDAGAPPPPPDTAPAVEESTAEFAFVERLLPPTRIPDPPPHPSYPTPSGWSPPTGQLVTHRLPWGGGLGPN